MLKDSPHSIAMARSKAAAKPKGQKGSVAPPVNGKGKGRASKHKAAELMKAQAADDPDVQAADPGEYDSISEAEEGEDDDDEDDSDSSLEPTPVKEKPKAAKRAPALDSADGHKKQRLTPGEAQDKAAKEVLDKFKRLSEAAKQKALYLCMTEAGIPVRSHEPTATCIFLYICRRAY